MEKHILVKSKSLDLTNKGSSTLLSNFGKASDTIDYNDFRKWAIDNVNLHKAIQPFEIIPSGSTEKEIIMSYLTELLKGLKVGANLLRLFLENGLKLGRTMLNMTMRKEML